MVIYTFIENDSKRYRFKNNTKPQQQVEPVLATVPAETVKKIEEVKPVPPKQIINEIIHIIVKGDTLWAIAKSMSTILSSTQNSLD